METKSFKVELHSFDHRMATPDDQREIVKFISEIWTKTDHYCPLCGVKNMWKSHEWEICVHCGSKIDIYCESIQECDRNVDHQRLEHLRKTTLNG